jgi:hypothetical protein
MTAGRCFKKLRRKTMKKEFVHTAIVLAALAGIALYAGLDGRTPTPETRAAHHFRDPADSTRLNEDENNVSVPVVPPIVKFIPIPFCFDSSVDESIKMKGTGDQVNVLALQNVSETYYDEFLEKRYCTALAFTSIGKFQIAYTIEWINKRQEQFYVEWRRATDSLTPKGR